MFQNTKPLTASSSTSPPLKQWCVMTSTINILKHPFQNPIPDTTLISAMSHVDVFNVQTRKFSHNMHRQDIPPLFLFPHPPPIPHSWYYTP